MLAYFKEVLCIIRFCGACVNYFRRERIIWEEIKTTGFRTLKPSFQVFSYRFNGWREHAETGGLAGSHSPDGFSSPFQNRSTLVLQWLSQSTPKLLICFWSASSLSNFQGRKGTEMIIVYLQVWIQCFNVWCIFFVTLTLFPAVMADIAYYSETGKYDFFIPGTFLTTCSHASLLKFYY